VREHGRPGRPFEGQFHHIGHRDDAHEPGDHGFQRPEPLAFQREDHQGHDPGEERGRQQRDAEEQVEAQRGAQELGQVRRHGHELADDPHAPDHRPWELVAAQLGQVAAGGDAQLGGERLDQHRR